MIDDELIFWVTIAHLKNWRTEKLNSLIIEILHKRGITLKDFFNLSELGLKDFGLNGKEIENINAAKNELSNTSFLVENIYAQGFEILPINSTDYSKILKNNLKIKYSPVVVYVKGNKQIMQEKSIAIVGARDASPIALTFTDNVAKNATKDFKVIVSGFAKGVDKQALDSALKYKGRSIIVIPQGILTFASGIKKYYEQIVEGDVVILSTFFPTAGWSVGLAMARNPIIYGLASEIFVAESNPSGGTWAGAIDGIRKGRDIFIRKPGPEENNANNILIEKGGTPVDMEGNILINEIVQQKTNNQDKTLPSLFD